MFLFSTRLGALTVFLTATLFAASAIAVGPITYDIDVNQSQLNLTASGNILGGALIVTEQYPNDLTKYDGTIEVEFPNGPWSPSASINFPGGSSAEAQVLRGGPFNLPRNVSPGVGGNPPNAPANYGLNFTAPLDIVLPEIPPEITGGLPISLGTLSGVQLGLALRDVVWDVQHNTPGGLAINGSDEFDASQVQIGLIGGYADLAGSLVLTQDNFITALILAPVLNGLLGGLNAGLSASNTLGSSDVLISIGTRVDLAGLVGNLQLPNETTDPGLLTWNNVNGASTLSLPVDITLGDFGFPPAIIDLDLGFSGQFVANGVVTVPEPASGSLFALAAVGFVSKRMRRRRLG